MKQDLLLFIDIDNCIMDSVFDNAHFPKDNLEKMDNLTKAYEKAKTTEIYPEFIEWYKRITSNEKFNIVEVHFITGRQSETLGWLTRIQLEPLQEIEYYIIDFYYNFAKHNWDVYKNFKVDTILNWLEYENFQGTILIYDDIDLSEEFKKALNVPFQFTLITKPEDWCEL